MPRVTFKTKEPPLNPENVKTISFTGYGQNPKSLIGKRIASATVPLNDNKVYALRLSFAEHPDEPVEIHALANTKQMSIETCNSLTYFLPKATPESPIKILGAATGQKKVVYAAPLCKDERNEELRALHNKKVIDEYELIGLALEGMDEMGWIWAEDRERSFIEGALKASVYIADGKRPGRDVAGWDILDGTDSDDEMKDGNTKARRKAKRKHRK